MKTHFKAHFNVLYSYQAHEYKFNEILAVIAISFGSDAL